MGQLMRSAHEHARWEVTARRARQQDRAILVTALAAAVTQPHAAHAMQCMQDSGGTQQMRTYMYCTCMFML